MPYAEAFTRFGVGGALALLTGAVWVLAGRHRPRTWWTLLWIAPFLVTMWSGWTTTSWGERYEYQVECQERWSNGVPLLSESQATTATTGPASAAMPASTLASSRPRTSFSKADFMSSCIDEQRAHADRRRADPDSSCDMEDHSGCPDSDYRVLWLGISGIVGTAGLLVSLGALIRPPRASRESPHPHDTTANIREGPGG